MKLFQKVYRWIILSVVIQLLILVFFNNYYLDKKGASVQVVKYKELGGFQVPTGAANIKTSFDGKYAGCFLENKLFIYSLDKKMEKAMNSEEEIVSYYKWLPDRETMIYALIKPETSQGVLEIKTYDVTTELESSYPVMKNLPKASEIIGIELSPLTNVVYVEVKINNDEKNIYRFDIMDNLDYVMTTALDTNIKEMHYSDQLVIQNNKKKIIIRNGKNNVSKSIFLEKKSVLLGLDAEDNVFVGELDKDNNVVAVNYRNFSKDAVETWQQNPLKGAALAKDIVITPKGDIYIVKENSLFNVIKDLEIPFAGTYVEISNNNLVTIENNELKLSPMPKE